MYDTLDGAKDMIEAATAAARTNTTATVVMPFHSIVIRIVSSYLQVAGMLLQFDLYLPPSIRTLITIEASTSSLSEQLLLFDCGTAVRNDRDLFLLKQGMSVWIIPLCSVALCFVFWWLLQRFVLVRKNSSMTGLDGFLSSLMVLFYTLFPSVVNRIALTFSCQNYGVGDQQKSLLTEALSVKCDSIEHLTFIFVIGVPGVLLYIAAIPTIVAMKLIKQRRAHTLYPSQMHYQSKWTLRFGFMFAGYKEGYEWWEVVVMLRKCCFVLLAIFLRPYGAAPQVVAASLVLVAALSATLQNAPYQDVQHNRIEVIGIQACLYQLMVALMCNLIQDKDKDQSGSPGTHDNLGPKSTAVLIFVVFGSTIVFFGTTIRATLQGSLNTKGAVGQLAWRSQKICGKRCCPSKQESDKSAIDNNSNYRHKRVQGKLAKVMARRCRIEQEEGNGRHRGEDRPRSLARVVPVQEEEQQRQQKSTLKNEIAALKWQKKIRQTLVRNNKGLKTSNSIVRVKSKRTRTVEAIQKNHQNHRALALKNIEQQQSQRRSSLQLRVEARKKEKEGEEKVTKGVEHVKTHAQAERLKRQTGKDMFGAQEKGVTLDGITTTSENRRHSGRLKRQTANKHFVRLPPLPPTRHPARLKRRIGKKNMSVSPPLDVQ